MEVDIRGEHIPVMFVNTKTMAEYQTCLRTPSGMGYLFALNFIVRTHALCLITGVKIDGI